MSAGAFTSSKYESDDGDIHPIRLQPETVLANIGGANTAPSGDIDNSISAKARGGIREYGLKARGVNVVFTSTLPTDYEAGNVYRIPILTRARYDAISVGTTGTYLSNPVRVVGKIPERVR